MKLAMRTVILLLTNCLALAAAPVADFATALEQAKANKVPIAVFLHGSDWNKSGETLLKAWNDPRFADVAGKDLLMVTIDQKENPSEAEKAASKRNEACQPPYRSLPAVALYDSEGRLVAARSGAAEIRESGGLPASVKSMRVVLTDRDSLWKRASGSAGVQRASLYGAGLDRMNQGLGPKNLYQPILDEIRKADPNDQSGYTGKYTFNRQALLDMAMDKATKNEQAAAELELNKWLRNTRLSPRQIQELHATRFALYQRWPEKKTQARNALEEMRKADPKSDLGLAAASYLKQLKDT
jgi:hypothetical protein